MSDWQPCACKFEWLKEGVTDNLLSECVYHKDMRERIEELEAAYSAQGNYKILYDSAMLLITMPGNEQAERIKELEQERDALKTRDIKLRAYAARMQHVADNEEYPMSKAELRTALKIACAALHRIACATIPTAEQEVAEDE